MFSTDSFACRYGDKADFRDMVDTYASGRKGGLYTVAVKLFTNTQFCQHVSAEGGFRDFFRDFVASHGLSLALSTLVTGGCKNENAFMQQSMSNNRKYRDLLYWLLDGGDGKPTDEKLTDGVLAFFRAADLAVAVVENDVLLE